MSKTMGDMIDDNQIVASFDAGDYLPLWRSGNTVGTRNQVIEQSVLTAAFPQQIDTLDDWISNDPAIASGVIAIISDENAYVIGNGSDNFTDLTMQYGPGKIKSLQDSDISTADATYNMATINAYPVGYRGRISWHSGDGSNDFQFVDSSASITLDGVDITDWVGDGTGHLDIVKTATNTWETLNDGVWDSDGGNFNSGNTEWSKYIDGTLEQRYPTTPSITSNSFYTWTFDIPFVGNLPMCNGNPTSRNAATIAFGSSGTDTRGLTSIQVEMININGGGNPTPATIEAKGRWTTSYPRKS